MVRTAPGVAVDAHGGAVIDPTANVIALNEASSTRLDDLRDMSERLHFAEIRRLDSEISHLKETVGLRAEHAKEISRLESDRLDKIRQVDVLAVSTAAERSQAATTTLATQQAASAETLRNLVTSSAAALAAQQSNTFAQITERISNLEKSMYTISGKSAFADPAQVELLAEVKALREARSSGEGKSVGGQQMWAWVVGAIGLLYVLVTKFGSAVTK